MLSGGQTPVRGISNNSPDLYGEFEFYFPQTELPQCRLDEVPSSYVPEPCPYNPTNQASLASLFTPNSPASDAYDVGFSLIALANVTDDYENALHLLGQAGQVFTQFGYKDEAKHVNSLMIDLAKTNGRNDDVAYYSALVAMGENNVAEIEKQLQDIPTDYAGREILDDYVTTYHKMERMAYTLAAAESLIEAHLSTMNETETSFLGWLFNTDFTEAKRAYAHARTAWKQRLESGRFDSTRAILQDIWKTDPKARVGIAMLAGYYNAWQGDENLGDNVSSYLTNHYGDHVTLGDLVEQEENPNPAEFRTHLSMVCANGDSGSKLEVSAVASIYREQADFSAHMNDLIDNEFVNRGAFVSIRDALHGFTQPTNIAIMVGSFGLARLTTVAIMAKVAPAGVEGLSLAARVGVTATEVIIESGSFTLYHRLLTQALTTQKVDWSADSFAKDWASLAICFGFLRASTIPLTSLRQTMGRTSMFGVEGAEPVIVGGVPYLQLNAAGQVVFGVTENMVQTAAFYGGGAVSYQMDLRDVPPNFFEEWLNLIQFQMGVRGANLVTNGWVDAKAYQIKTRPLLEAAQTIAEGIVGEKSALADAVAQHIFLAHVRGDISATSMLNLTRNISKGEMDSTSDVLKINTILKEAHLPLLWDGIKLYEVSPEVRDAYVDELTATEGTGGQIDLPSLAYAVSTPARSMIITSDTQTSDTSAQIYFATSIPGVVCSEPKSARNAIIVDIGNGSERSIDTKRFPERVSAYDWSKTTAADAMKSIEKLLTEAADHETKIADDTREVANREYAGQEMPEGVKKMLDDFDVTAITSLEQVAEFKHNMQALEYIYRYAPNDSVRELIDAGMETILKEAQQLELQSTTLTPDAKAKIIYEQVLKHMEEVIREAEGLYVNDRQIGLIEFLSDAILEDGPVSDYGISIPPGIEVYHTVFRRATKLGIEDLLIRSFDILLSGADSDGNNGKSIREALQGYPLLGEVRFNGGAAPRFYFTRRLGDGKIHLLECGRHNTQPQDIARAQSRFQDLLILLDQ